MFVFILNLYIVHCAPAIHVNFMNTFLTLKEPDECVLNYISMFLLCLFQDWSYSKLLLHNYYSEQYVFKEVEFQRCFTTSLPLWNVYKFHASRQWTFILSFVHSHPSNMGLLTLRCNSWCSFRGYFQNVLWQWKRINRLNPATYLCLSPAMTWIDMYCGICCV